MWILDCIAYSTFITATIFFFVECDRIEKVDRKKQVKIIEQRSSNNIHLNSNRKLAN